MARVIKNEEPWHVITIIGEHDSKFLLVGDADYSYLSVHTETGFDYIEGPATLRALARAILRTVPAPKKRNTKRRK